MTIYLIALLSLVGLVAYFIGRARSQQRLLQVGIALVLVSVVLTAWRQYLGFIQG